MKVLMIEDVTILLEAFGQMVKKLGLEFTGISDAEEAVDHIKANEIQYDIYMIDINLNHQTINGVDLVKIIREKCPDKIIIVETGNYKIEEELKPYNVDKILYKPYNMREAKECLISFLNEHGKAKEA